MSENKKSYDVIVSVILDAPLDRYVEIASLVYKNIRFFQDNEYGYSWSAKAKNHARVIYPMKNSSEIKHFKTLQGAKRNCIRTLFRFGG